MGECLILLNCNADSINFNKELGIQRSSKYFEWQDSIYTKNSLNRLCISNCSIADAEPVAANFLGLTYMNLSFNSLKDLSCIASLVGLKYLDISHNKISSLNFADQLTELVVLRCQNNRIELLESLKQCCSISELWVSNNKLTWAQFIFLSNMKQLISVVKFGNPCDDKPKFDEFLSYVAPSIRVIDGLVINTTSGDDAPISTDIKVMITQARAQLVIKESAFKNNHKSSKHVRKGGGSGSSDLCADAAAASHIDVTEIGSSSSKNSSNSTVIGAAAALGHDDITAAAVVISVAGSPTKRTKAEKLPLRQVAQGTTSTADNNPDKVSAAIPRDHGKDIVKSLKFSALDDSPVALCLHANGDGYIRYDNCCGIEFVCKYLWYNPVPTSIRKTCQRQ
jgi:hypothetical protein